jgi:ribosomal protein L37AE/L43A
MASGLAVTCGGCGNEYAVRQEVGLWSCPICRTSNDVAAVLAGTIVGSAESEARRKPVSMRLADAWSRLTGKRPLYAYADRLIAVRCPQCSAVVNMTKNVRIAKCSGCTTIVQRA